MVAELKTNTCVTKNRPACKGGKGPPTIKFRPN